jgi:alpha-L-rhamnosidase
MSTRLSWQLESTLRGQKQIAYRVLVARPPEALQADRGILWDSGRVASNQSVNVPYEGKPLISGQRCFWKVMVWGTEGAGSAWSDPSFYNSRLRMGRCARI